MTTPNTSYSHAATVFPVSDMEKSIVFYRDQLQFEVLFTWMEPIDYAVLKKDGIGIHLTLQDTRVVTSGRTALHVFVHDVDAVYANVKQHGTIIHTTIGDREYGMRDFDVKDPDGHIISFGMGIK